MSKQDEAREILDEISGERIKLKQMREGDKKTESSSSEDAK